MIRTHLLVHFSLLSHSRVPKIVYRFDMKPYLIVSELLAEGSPQ